MQSATHDRRTGIVIAIALILVLALGGGAVARAETPQMPVRSLQAHAHDFVYYPRSGIYYAPLQDRWFWRERGDWQQGRKLPVEYADALRDGVRVTLDTDRPWERHEVVRRQYPDAR